MSSRPHEPADTHGPPPPTGPLVPLGLPDIATRVRPVVDEAQRMAAATPVSGRRAVSRGTMLMAFYVWLLSGVVMLSYIAQRT